MQFLFLYPLWDHRAVHPLRQTDWSICSKWLLYRLLNLTGRNCNDQQRSFPTIGPPLSSPAWCRKFAGLWNAYHHTQACQVVQPEIARLAVQGCWKSGQYCGHMQSLPAGTVCRRVLGCFSTTKLFGMRGGDEHWQLCCKQFCVDYDAVGRYSWFMGISSKMWSKANNRRISQWKTSRSMPSLN